MAGVVCSDLISHYPTGFLSQRCLAVKCLVMWKVCIDGACILSLEFALSRFVKVYFSSSFPQVFPHRVHDEASAPSDEVQTKQHTLGSNTILSGLTVYNTSSPSELCIYFNY